MKLRELLEQTGRYTVLDVRKEDETLFGGRVFSSVLKSANTNTKELDDEIEGITTAYDFEQAYSYLIVNLK